MMCIRYVALLLFACLPLATSGQTRQAAEPVSSTSRPEANPAGQTTIVQYDMDVTVHPDRHAIEGRQRLTYANTSPDTLSRVFYHLYFNAFQPHSMMAERNRELPDPDPRTAPRIFDLGPDEIGYHRIESLTQDGEPVSHHAFDTVLEVTLARPLPPGGQAVFDMTFVSQIPLQTRRSGRDSREGIDYSMTQWYPKLAQYDARGWHADPYVGREFYAPFGTFDVRITLPSEYIVGATGTLRNPEEVGHGYASDSLNTDAPAAQSDSLTWRFYAENVHDFAWSADPDYIHDVLETEAGYAIHLLYQPDVAEVWRTLHEAAPKIMAFFEARYGPYLYPQMTIAQGGDGGMEYPMITLVTGRRPPPSLHGVTAHEVAHMWFYGMIGSNEADYAWMDEGFTSYATREALAHLRGQPRPSHAGALVGILNMKRLGLFEPLNTPSDWFDTNAAYGVASYSGGEMMLDMLGYVISDSLRDRFLLEYHRQYAFRHAGPHDVERVAEQVSGIHLDWYFQQFGDANRELDYAIRRFRSNPHGTEWRATMTLKRHGRAVMPIDLQITLADGSVQWVHIPLGVMRGHKPVPEDWIVAEPWPWTSPEYALDVMLPVRPRRAEIDPYLRTPESNRLDNTTGRTREYSFLQPPAPNIRRFDVGWRPLVQYAQHWGPGIGVQFRGAYALTGETQKKAVTIWPQVLFSSGEKPDVARRLAQDESPEFHALNGVDYNFSRSEEYLKGYLINLSGWAEKQLGIYRTGLEVSFSDPDDLLRKRSRRYATGARMHFQSNDRANVWNTSGAWMQDVVSVYGRMRGTSDWYRYVFFAEFGRWFAEADEWFPGFTERGEWSPRFAEADEESERWYSANRVSMDLSLGAPVGPFTGSVRLFAGAGSNDLSPDKLFRFGGVSIEEQWSDAAYRNVEALFEEPLADANWVAFGAPGPVAYMRQEKPYASHRHADDHDGHETSRAAEEPFFLGVTEMVAFSARLLTPRLQGPPLLRPLRLELFMGTGYVGDLSKKERDERRKRTLMDAGLGVRYDLNRLRGFDRWIKQSDVLSDLVLVARFPLWANDYEYADSDKAFAFRWVFGVQLDRLPWD